MFTFDQAKVVRLIPVKRPSSKELNLLVLRKFFDSSGITGVTRVVRSDSGDLIVTFAEWGGAQQLRFIKKINGIEIKLVYSFRDNSVLGVISHTEIEHLEEEELAELIGDQLSIIRKLTSTAALVGFPKELPSSVLLGWEKIPVKPYQRRPTRCYKCQKYGHLARKCRAREVCSSCGTPGHIDADCLAAVKKCAACGGPHSSSDRECPKWREECRVAKLRTKERLRYKEALLVVKNQEKKKQDKNKIKEPDNITLSLTSLIDVYENILEEDQEEEEWKVKSKRRNK